MKPDFPLKAMVSKHYKIILFLLYPFVLYIMPFNGFFILLGVALSVLLLGGGWDNLGNGLMGGIVGFAVGSILLSILFVIVLFKDSRFIHKIAISIILIAYTFSVDSLITFKSQAGIIFLGKADDYLRLEKIQEVKSKIEVYYRNNNQLPEHLRDLASANLPPESYIDLVTFANITYTRGEGLEYQLCADFDKGGTLNYVVSQGGKHKSQKYKSGISCFDFKANQYGYFKLN